MQEVSTSEAVRQFQMHPATVLRLILTQRVAAHKDANGKWLIRRSDLERWNRQRKARKAEQTSTQVESIREVVA